MMNQPQIDQLTKAVADPAYRARLKVDPVAALKEAGIEVPSDQRENFDKAHQRAIADPAYRARLKADPIAGLKEAGVEVPQGLEVRILEFDPNVGYLFLPPASPASG